MFRHLNIQSNCTRKKKDNRLFDIKTNSFQNEQNKNGDEE
jgi:hypothetical protein